MIVLARALHKLCFEIAADLGEGAREIADCEVGEHVASMFRDEDQVNVQRINNVPALANVHVAAPETKL